MLRVEHLNCLENSWHIQDRLWSVSQPVLTQRNLCQAQSGAKLDTSSFVQTVTVVIFPSSAHAVSIAITPVPICEVWSGPLLQHRDSEGQPKVASDQTKSLVWSPGSISLLFEEHIIKTAIFPHKVRTPLVMRTQMVWHSLSLPHRPEREQICFFLLGGQVTKSISQSTFGILGKRWCRIGESSFCDHVWSFMAVEIL